jgi:hypothetical protein
MAEDVDLKSRAQASESERLAQKSEEAFQAAEASPDPATKAEKLDEAQAYAGDSALASAYTYLQQVVGVIAVLLPFVLVAGNRLLSGDELESSISAYYHTRMGDVFVGALCALAVFFLSYNYKPLPGFNLDNKLSTLASVAAFGVAFFPTTSDASVATQSEQVVGRVHLAFAALLFGLLAVFALFLFPRTGSASVTRMKQRRNVGYRTCGGIIVGAIVLVGCRTSWTPRTPGMRSSGWRRSVSSRSASRGWSRAASLGSSPTIDSSPARGGC